MTGFRVFIGSDGYREGCISCGENAASCGWNSGEIIVGGPEDRGTCDLEILAFQVDLARSFKGEGLSEVAGCTLGAAVSSGYESCLENNIGAV